MYIYKPNFVPWNNSQSVAQTTNVFIRASPREEVNEKVNNDNHQIYLFMMEGKWEGKIHFPILRRYLYLSIEEKVKQKKLILRLAGERSGKISTIYLFTFSIYLSSLELIAFWEGILHFLRRYKYDISFSFTLSPWSCSNITSNS